MTKDVPASGDAEHESNIVQPENFAFVMNVWHLIDGPSYTIIPGYVLRRATAEETAVIKEIIETMGPGPQTQYQHLWEERWPHSGGRIEYLAEPEWRYFVIAFRESNATLSQLGDAFDLSLLELDLAFSVLYPDLEAKFGRALTWNPGRLFHVLEKAPFNQSFFRDVSVSDIGAIRDIYSQLQNNDQRIVHIKPLAKQLGQLKGLPHSSPLRFLGYFALLESLLTHPPRPSDPYDAITRQVKKKLALLANRWSQPLDYSPFQGATEDTIWSKMYAYRSLVAHGGTPTFTGDLVILRNHDTALALLKETVKAVIRQALMEPQLLLDLREC